FFSDANTSWRPNPLHCYQLELLNSYTSVWPLDEGGRLNLCREAVELAIEPFPDFHVIEQIALLTELELTVGDIDTLEDIRCSERAEHRFERIVKDEHMCGRATSRDRKHGFVAKRLWRQDVEKGLQGAGVSRLINRRGHDQAAPPSPNVSLHRKLGYRICQG